MRTGTSSAEDALVPAARHTHTHTSVSSPEPAEGGNVFGRRAHHSSGSSSSLAVAATLSFSLLDMAVRVRNPVCFAAVLPSSRRAVQVCRDPMEQMDQLGGPGHGPSVVSLPQPRYSFSRSGPPSPLGKAPFAKTTTLRFVVLFPSTLYSHFLKPLPGVRAQDQPMLTAVGVCSLKDIPCLRLSWPFRHRPERDPLFVLRHRGLSLGHPGASG